MVINEVWFWRDKYIFFVCFKKGLKIILEEERYNVFGKGGISFIFWGNCFGLKDIFFYIYL